MNKIIILITLFITFALMACVDGKKPVETIKQQKTYMSVKEQEEKSMVKMNEILEITSTKKKEEAIPFIISGYRDIMENYPESFMAEEGYYRLMIINLRDYYPPKIKEAEAIYKEYFRRYRKPRIGMSMTGDLARYYYANGMWEKLSRFTVPFMREFAKSGKYGDTVFLFLYTESRFHLEDYNEARKGYNIVLKNSAEGSSDYNMAINRLEAIKKAMEAQKKESGK